MYTFPVHDKLHLWPYTTNEPYSMRSNLLALSAVYVCISQTFRRTKSLRYAKQQVELKRLDLIEYGLIVPYGQRCWSGNVFDLQIWTFKASFEWGKVLNLMLDESNWLNHFFMQLLKRWWAMPLAVASMELQNDLFFNDYMISILSVLKSLHYFKITVYVSHLFRWASMFLSISIHHPNVVQVHHT
jgi:hypothetical protein